MEEPAISWNEMTHPDMEAIAKRDAFLSDESGKTLNEQLKVFWPDIEESDTND